MPGVRKTKKRNLKSRKFKSRSKLNDGGFRNNPSMGPVSRDAFPLHNTRKMTYGQVNTLTAPATTGALGAVQSFSLSNLFDPDITGAGHQPYGRDQMASIYHRYKVDSVHISLVCTIPSRDGMFVALKIMSPNDTDTITGETYAVCAEDPKIRTKQINAPNTLATRWDFNVNHRNFMGLSKSQLDANIEAYSALYITTTGPARRLNLDIALADPSGVGGTILCFTVITYNVRSWERTDFGQS